jgi:hypothetical protein
MSEFQGHSAAGRIISLENPMTTSGIEPATIRLVATYMANIYKHLVVNLNKWYPFEEVSDATIF